MFHHLRVSHNLLIGDIDKFHEETRKAKEIFNIGDKVKCLGPRKIEGTLVTMTSKYGVIKINGKYKVVYLGI